MRNSVPEMFTRKMELDINRRPVDWDFAVASGKDWLIELRGRLDN